MSKEEEVRKSNSFNRNNGRSKQELARKLLKVAREFHFSFEIRL